MVFEMMPTVPSQKCAGRTSVTRQIPSSAACDTRAIQLNIRSFQALNIPSPCGLNGENRAAHSSSFSGRFTGLAVLGMKCSSQHKTHTTRKGHFM